MPLVRLTFALACRLHVYHAGRQSERQGGETSISQGIGLLRSLEGCQAAAKMQEKRRPAKPQPEPPL